MHVILQFVDRYYKQVERNYNDNIAARKSCHLTIDEQTTKTVARNVHLHREMYIMKDHVYQNVTLKIKSLSSRKAR